MKKYKILIAFIIIITSLSSCMKEIEIDDSLIERKLVVNGFITQDSLISVNIGISKPIPGVQTDFAWLDDAIVELYVDGEKTEELTYYPIDAASTDGNFYYYGGTNSSPTGVYKTQQTIGEIGKSYKLVVSHPNYKTAICETTIPQPVTIDKITSEERETNHNGWVSVDLYFKLNFTDPADQKNYYRVNMGYKIGNGYTYYDYKEEDTVTYVSVQESVSSYYLYTDDPILTTDENADELLFGSPSNDYNLFDDKLINGKEYDLEFYYPFDSYGDEEDPRVINDVKGEFYQFDISFSTLSREAYLYMKSTNEQSYYDDMGFFVEPVQAYSNVVNGLGVFAGYSSSYKTVADGEYPVDGVEYKYYDYYY